MKKILFGLIVLFIGSQLMVSCSSESNVLSQFSKRKYMKRFNSKDAKHQYEINKRNNNFEYVEAQDENYASLEMMKTNFDISELEEVDNSNLVELPEEKKAELNLIKEPLKDYSKVYDYNEVRTVEKYILIDNIESHKVAKASQVNEIVLGILCVFIPPLAVFLYENSITTNFWVDLIGTLLFWLPGIILAFLIVFGGVSF